MPRIPLYNHIPQGTGPANVRADTGIFNAEAAAASRVGQAVAGLGDVAAEAMVRAQKAEIYRSSAELDVAMQGAWAEFETTLNPNSDESKWTEQWQKKLEHVTSQHLSKAKGAGKRELELQVAQFRVRSLADVSTQSKVASVEKGRRAGMTLVNAAWANGDEVAAEAHLARMADAGFIYKEQIPQMVAEGREQMHTAQAVNDLNELRNLPPAKAKTALSRFGQDITAKDDNGNAKAYPGMSLANRLKLQDSAESKARELQAAMDTNGRRVISELRMGRATLADLTAEVEAGNLDEATALAIRPDAAAAIAEYKAKQDEEARVVRDREEAEGRRVRGEARGRQNRFEELMAGVAPLGKQGVTSEKAITEALRLEEITPEQAVQLRGRLGSAARYEQASTVGAFQELRDDIHALIIGKLFGSADPDETEYQKLLGQIATSKLSATSRMKLVEELLAVRLTDIGDLEEGQSTSWQDRDITPPELDLRRDIVGELRRQLPNLGDVGTGDALFACEDRIRSFFDGSGGKPRTPAEITAFKQQLISEIQQSAGSAILKEVFDF